MGVTAPGKRDMSALPQRRSVMDAPDYGREIKERIEREIRQHAGEGIKRPKVMVLGDFRWGLVWGAIIVMIGVALLLDHMGIRGFDRIYRFWPMILVVFGVMNILTESNRGFGILLIGAGTILQLNKLGYLHLTFAELWPLAIIGVGLLVMWGSLETRGFLRGKVTTSAAAQGGGALQDTLHAVAIFGGSERTITTQNFRGGKVTAVFGGIEMDFRDADIEGDEAVVEINCLFGGVEIRVPETWHVYSRNLPVFGGYSDKTRGTKRPDQTDLNKKTLAITGTVLFGGIEIKN
jgi:predicted membrane protein